MIENNNIKNQFLHKTVITSGVQVQYYISAIFNFTLFSGI